MKKEVNYVIECLDIKNDTALLPVVSRIYDKNEFIENLNEIENITDDVTIYYVRGVYELHYCLSLSECIKNMSHKEIMYILEWYSLYTPVYEIANNELIDRENELPNQNYNKLAFTMLENHNKE